MDSTSTASAAASPGPEPARGLLAAGHFLSLVRFSHTVFALPFALLACILAVYQTPALDLSVFETSLRFGLVIICMVTARNAAMAFNRLVDVDVDRDNPRTAARHLVTGILTKRQVVLFWMANVIVFIAACAAFWPNWLPVAAAIPVIVWLCGYSYAKRFTSAAHLWLGVALALSPVCAWIALRGEFVLTNPAELISPLLLAGAIAFWVAGFDIIYACQDADYDRSRGLHSIPSRLGVGGALKVAALFHALMLAILVLLPLLSTLPLGWLYWLAFAVVAILVVRQHWLVRPGDLGRVGQAFFQINAIISLGFCSLVALDCLLG